MMANNMKTILFSLMMHTLVAASASVTFPDRCDFTSSTGSHSFVQSIMVPYIGTLLPDSQEPLRALFMEAYNTQACGYRSAQLFHLTILPQNPGMLHFNVSGRVCSFCSPQRRLRPSSSLYSTDNHQPALNTADADADADALKGRPSKTTYSRLRSNRLLKGKRETSVPTTLPSSYPTTSPSASPTSKPSDTPTSKPSYTPTSIPSMSPTSKPSMTPSLSPTSIPSLSPTSIPSLSPSMMPSGAPSSQPSALPSAPPSLSPTSNPSAVPSALPSSIPSNLPSTAPSSRPSSSPSSVPSVTASSSPSETPSSTPSSIPSSQPSFSDLDICGICQFSTDAVTRQFSLASQMEVDSGNLPGMRYVGTLFSQPVDCPAEMSSFSANALVSVVLVDRAQNGEASQPDVEILQDIFGSTYNALAFHLCDQQFRSVSSVSFQTQSFRRLESTNSNSRQLQEQIVASYRLDVNGTCRDCADGVTLFSPTNRRARQLSTDSMATIAELSLFPRRTQSDICTCSIDTMFEGQAPTGMEFEDAFNKTVVALNVNDVLVTVQEVQSVTEIQKIACDRDIQTFSGTIFTAFDADPTNVELSEVITLGDQFVSSYNTLGEDFCDPLFRTLTSATLSTRAFRRRLDTRNLAVRVTADYETAVNGTCRRCSSDTPAFSLPDRTIRSLNSFSSRAAAPSNKRTSSSIYADMIMVEQRSHFGHSRFLQDASCFCTTEGLENPRAPNADEFVVAYSNDVETLIEEGVLRNIEGVAGVTEAFPVPCSPDINPFSSTLLMSVDADVSLIASTEVEILENTFGSSYNELGDSFCDPFFRSVSSTKFTLQANRRLQTNGRRELEVVTAMYKIDVNATCRGCESNATLLSEGITTDATRSLVETRSLHRARHLQTAACVCTQEARGNPRAPNADELLAFYRTQLDELRQESSILHVYTINSIVELPKDTSSPSSEPSQFPSTMPTISSSVSPSLAPVTAAPSALAIFECNFDLLLRVNTMVKVTFNLTGDAQMLGVSDIESAFTEGYNALRTSQCEPFVIETSVISGRRLQSSIIAAFTLDISWLCESSGNCDGLQLFGGIGLSEVLTLILRRDDFDGVTTESFVVVPPAPSAWPSAAPSLTPVLVTSAPVTATSAPTGLTSTQCLSSETFVILSFDSFEDGSEGEWQNGKVDPSYKATLSSILGPFRVGNPFPTRPVTVPESFSLVFVSFVFYEIDGWDGDHIEFGTDKLGMEINGDENDTIDFGWFKQTASEDGSSGTSTSGNIQWSIKSKSVTDSPQGYSRDFDDQEHMISIVIPSQYFATSHSLSLTITWDLNDSDEIVGIDDFSVSGCAA